LVLQAIAGLSDRRRVVLSILGEGPETSRWRELADRLALDGITWHGRLPYREALAVMGNADLFIHSSYREAASMVVLEAMGWGLPIVCHDACGMATAVDPTCGIKVPFVDPETSIRGIREAVEGILAEPESIGRMSVGALRRASELSWDTKVEEISRTYLECARAG
jgi:glycosyltransferase involved in cell wall biosynthesis